ncbi:MAG: actin-related protein 2/3 complex subunit 5 family protein [Actinomycetota bacterium]|nr:actin-related protein 2/3 complex subunit 5 family protein [Actinomycetota bacterium]
MSTPPPGQPSEEELRAAYEAEIKKLRVEDVVIQTVVSLVNLGGRKAGLAPGTEDERDPEQLRMAIDASRALLPLVEDELGPDAGQVRNALSQLQMAYAQSAQEGGGPGETPSAQEPQKPQQPQQPQQPPSSGRLWVPGQ